MPEMLLDDLVEILFIHVAVPDALWIHHDNRPLVAAVHAAGGVDADVVPQTGNAEFGNLVFHVLARLRRAALGTAVAAIRAFIGAEKNMLIVKTHGKPRMDGVKVRL